MNSITKCRIRYIQISNLHYSKNTNLLLIKQIIDNSTAKYKYDNYLKKYILKNSKENINDLKYYNQNYKFKNNNNWKFEW